jgi:serine/threonine protein kinase
VKAGMWVGQYQVKGALGAGGMGEVYRAHDTKLERDVALKVLPKEFAQDSMRAGRFKVEAKVLASVNHPNIVSIYDIQDHESGAILVLELVEGEALNDRLKRAGKLPVAEVLRISRHIASALEAAHAKGIVHRDLKPANVIVDSRNVAKVLDFGIAHRFEADAANAVGRSSAGPALGRVLSGTGESDAEANLGIAPGLEARMTTTGMLVGTAPYMSPEQVQGAPIDKRSDIWSFGCLVFELLSGRPPFDRKMLTPTLVSILTDNPDWGELPAQVPDRLLALIRRCLRKDPNERLHDIADARIEIDELLDELKDSSEFGRRNRRLAGSVVTALAIGLAGFVALDIGGSRAWFSGAGLPAFDPAAISSIVALPTEVTTDSEAETEGAGLFANAASDTAYAYFTDALPATLTTALGGLEGVDTKLPPTSVELASIDGDLGALADMYGVSAFVKTDLTVRNDSFFLGIDLQDARSGDPLWNRALARPRGDYLALMGEAAALVGEALRPDALPLEPQSLGASGVAELELRRGQFYAGRYRAYMESGDLELATSAFHRALEENPNLGVAAAELGFTYGVLLQLGLADASAWTEMETWASRAQAADSTGGLGWALQPGLEAWRGEEGFEARRLASAAKAAGLAPLEARVHSVLGQVLTSFSLSLGAESFSQAVRVRPLMLSARTNLVASLATAGRLDEAMAEIGNARRIQSSEQWAALMTEGSILAMRRRTVEARLILDQLESLVEGGALPGDILFELRLEFALATGDTEGARELQANILASIRSPRTPPPWVWNLVVASSSAFAMAGDADAAFEILDGGADRGVLMPYDYLILNDRLASLRADERFEDVAAASRARFEEMLVVLDSVRARGELPAYLDSALDGLVSQLDLR